MSETEGVLDAFAAEPRHDRETLERYLREHPALAAELIDLSAELRLADAPDGPLPDPGLEAAWEEFRRSKPRGPAMRYWLSWVQPGADYRPIGFPPPPEVLGWWCTGEGEGGHTLCALVAADSEDGAKAVVTQPSLWADAGEWRFCDPKPAAWRPGDRSPLPDWSPLRRTDDRE